MRGVVPAGIEDAVPTIREWRHAGLPRALITADDVKRVLAAVDETHPNGYRDRARLLQHRRTPPTEPRSPQVEVVTSARFGNWWSGARP